MAVDRGRNLHRWDWFSNTAPAPVEAQVLEPLPTTVDTVAYLAPPKGDVGVGADEQAEDRGLGPGAMRRCCQLCNGSGG